MVICPRTTNGCPGSRSLLISAAPTDSSPNDEARCTVPAPTTAGSRHGSGARGAQSTFSVAQPRWKRSSDARWGEPVEPDEAPVEPVGVHLRDDRVPGGHGRPGHLDADRSPPLDHNPVDTSATRQHAAACPEARPEGAGQPARSAHPARASPRRVRARAGASPGTRSVGRRARRRRGARSRPAAGELPRRACAHRRGAGPAACRSGRTAAGSAPRCDAGRALRCGTGGTAP